MPPDDDRERSELDEALFASTESVERTARAQQPPVDEPDLAGLDAALFGESVRPRSSVLAPVAHRRTRRTDRVSRRRALGLGAVVALVLVGAAASAFALFGDDGGSTPVPKVEARGANASRTTLGPTTTVTTVPPTTTSTTTTTVAPTTTRAPVVLPQPEPEPPATDPPVVVPPTDPPPTQPPPTSPPPTTTNAPPTTTKAPTSTTSSS